MENTDQNTPSLEELVYFIDEDSNDEFSQPNNPDPATGFDPFGDDDPEQPDQSPEDFQNPQDTQDGDVESTEYDEPDSSQQSVDEEPETESTEDVDTQDDQQDAEEDNIYSKFYNVLRDQGIVQTDDEYQFDGTPEGLQKAFESTKDTLKKAIADDLWAALPEDFRSVLQYGLAGGQSVKDILDLKANYALDDFDLSQKVDQREVMKRYFAATTQYDHNKIEKMVDKLDMAGTLAEDAEEAVSELKDIQAAQEAALIQQQETLREQQRQQAEETRRNISQIIDDYEAIQTNRKGKVKAFLFNTVTRDGTPNTDFNRVLQQISSNQEHLVQLADLLLDYDPKKGLKLDRFVSASKSKAAQQLRDKLESLDDTKTKVSGKGSKVPKSSFNWEEFLRQN